MEGKIRKQRQETLYIQREKRRKFIEVVAIVLFGVVIFGAILGFIILLRATGHI
jgi:preprotein translocase subunit Sss1